MKKMCAFLFVVCYIAMSAVVHADIVEVKGKALNCQLRSKDFYHCLEGREKIIVTMSEQGFVAIKKGTSGYPVIEVVSKISDSQRVLYLIDPGNTAFEDTLGNRRKNAEIVTRQLSKSQDELAKELVSYSQAYLAQNDNFEDVSIKRPDGSLLSCTKGKERAASAQEVKVGVTVKCNFYSCQGVDPEEKILAYYSNNDYVSFTPHILSMKKGQAQYIDGQFQVMTKKGELIQSIPLNEYSDEYVDPVQRIWGLDNNIFIPSKYEESKSSYYYLRATNKYTGYLEESQLCEDEKLRPLFSEKKRIADEMEEELAKAEIIEYLKTINGNIQSFYVDKKQGLTLGCLHQGKVVDKDVVSSLNYLNKVSNPPTATKPLSEKEVQDLYRNAASMKDIPFEYKRNGCYARAHLMARRFEKMGIPTQKIWIKGDLSVPGTDIRWNYHVAPVVDVKGKNGKIQKYVIDPSLAEKAVPVDEWVARMEKNTKGPIVKSTYPPPVNTVDFQRTTVSISSSDAFAPEDRRQLTEADKMKNATETLKEYSDELARMKSGRI